MGMHVQLLFLKSLIASVRFPIASEAINHIPSASTHPLTLVLDHLHPRTKDSLMPLLLFLLTDVVPV